MKIQVLRIAAVGVLASFCASSVAAPAPPAGRPKEIASFEADRFRVNDLAFSPDGKILATAGSEGELKLWNVADWKKLVSTRAHFGNARLGQLGKVWNVAFSPDGKVAASRGDDRKLRLWEVPTGRHLDTLDNCPLDNGSLAFSPDGKTLCCGPRQIDLKTKEWRRIVPQQRGVWPTGAFDAKGKLLFATASQWPEAPCFWLWDTSTGKIAFACKGHTKVVMRIVFSPDRKIVASSSFDHTIRLWDTATGQLKATFKDCPGRYHTLAFSPNGRILAVSYKHQEADGETDSRPDRGSVRLYETSTGRVLATLEGQPGPVCPLAFSPDGRLLASGSFNGTITIWSLPKRYAVDPAPSMQPGGQSKKIASFPAHPDHVQALAFSPDGKTLISGGDEGHLKLWEAASWKNLTDIRAHFGNARQEGTGRVFNVAFSPDGKTVASTGTDRLVKLWDIATGHNVETFDDPLFDAPPLMFSPDGKTVVCGSQLFDLETKNTRRIVERLKGSPPTAAFDPKGNLLFATASDFPEPPGIWLWDTKAGKIAVTCKGQTKYGGCIAFSRDGKVVASANSDHGVRLWDVPTGNSKGIFKKCPGRPCSLMFAPDGSILAVGYKHQEADGQTDSRPDRGSVRLYETSTGRVLATLEGQPGPICPLAFSPDGTLLASGSFNGAITIWSLPKRYAEEGDPKGDRK